MKKKAFVTLGVVFGLSASMFAMLPSATRTEAAVPVIDKTNIEHACRIRAPPEPFVRVKCAESARKGGSDAHIRLTDRELRC